MFHRSVPWVSRAVRCLDWMLSSGKEGILVRKSLIRVDEVVSMLDANLSSAGMDVGGMMPSQRNAVKQYSKATMDRSTFVAKVK